MTPPGSLRLEIYPQKFCSLFSINGCSDLYLPVGRKLLLFGGIKFLGEF